MKKESSLRFWKTLRLLLSASAIAFSLTLVSVSPVAYAQSTAADIVGIVRDASGGVLASILVKAVQEETGYSRETLSNAEGSYEFRIMPPGTYTITAESQGFKKYINAHIRLTARDVLRVDIGMEVGALTESITVVAKVPAITTETGTVAETREAKLLTDGPRGTPINLYFGLDTMKTSLLVREGANSASPKGGGSRANQYETLVDGNATEVQLTQTPYSAMAEEKQTVIGAPAEFRAPLTMNAVTKGGTNDFHGAATFQYTNVFLNAYPPTYRGAPRARLPGHVWNLTAGGPVYIPKIYNGRNRTFLFVSAERQTPTDTTSPSQPVPYDVPTLDMRAGNFQRYFNATSRPSKVLTDPLGGLPFAGNVIPRSRWNPAAVKAIDTYYPVPNVSGANPDVPFQNANGPYYNKNTFSTMIARLDQKITQKNTFTFTYSQTPTYSEFSNGASNGTLATGGLGNNLNISPKKAFAWSDTHVISPRIVNEARVYYFDFSGFLGFTTTVGQVADALGLNLGPDAAALRNNVHQAPNINITGYQKIGSVYSDTNIPVQSWTQVRDNLSVVSGRHTFKTGYDQRFKKLDQTSSSSATGGSWTFDGSLTGDPMADFMLGLPRSTQRYTPGVSTFKQRYNELGLFAQDDYKPTARLTLNIGLRMERVSPRTEANGLQYNFDPKTGALVFPNDASIAKIVPAWPASIKRETAAQAGFPTDLTNATLRFCPRIGFAYRLSQNSDTVLRGSYSVFAVSAGINQKNYATGPYYTGPFGISETFLNTVTNGVPLVTLDRPFPTGTGTVASTFSVNGVNPNVGLPFMQQWSITLERRLAGQWAARLSYVGSRQTQLGYQSNLSTPPPSLIPFTTSRLLYPPFVSVAYKDKGNTSNYRALQFGMSHRYGNGLLVDGILQFIYERSDQGENDVDNQFIAIENPYCRRCELQDSAVPVVNSRVNFVYDLPLGRGKRIGANWNRWINGVVGGWSASGLFNIQTGMPFPVIFSGADPSNTNTSGGRADVIPGCDIRPGDGHYVSYLNLACFAVPPKGRFGNSSPSVFHLPGSYNVDSSVYKYFSLYRERVKLRISARARNTFNHVEWAGVGNNISSPQSFGQLIYSGGYSGPRNVAGQAQILW